MILLKVFISRVEVVLMTKVWDQYTVGRYELFDKKQTTLELKYIKLNQGKYLPGDKRSKILEIGFGRGSFLAYLKTEGYTNYLGIEIGKSQFNFVKKNITSRVKLLTNTLDFLRKHKHTYDVIFLGEVIAHLPKNKVIAYLTAIRQSLTAQGILLIKTPSITNPFCLRSVSNDFTYTTLYSYESIKQILSLAGFNKILIEEETFKVGLKGYVYQGILSTFNFFLRLILILHNRTNNLILTKMMLIKASV